MKMRGIFILFTLLTAPLITTSKIIVTCENSGISKTNGTLMLKSTDENLTLVFIKETYCIFNVIGYKWMDFALTVVDFNLESSQDCTSGYVQAGPTYFDALSNSTLTVCTKKQEGASMNSTNGMLYINVYSTEAPMDKPYNLTFNFKSIPEPQCEPTAIALFGATHTQSYPKAGTSLTKSDCNISVTGYGGREFNMTIPEMYFDNCEDSYVAAAGTKAGLENPDYKKCGMHPVTDAIQSNASAMFLRILTGQNITSANVTFLFETIFPECGASEVPLTSRSQMLQLPVVGDFPPYTDCIIKVFDRNGRNFRMSIENIHFPENCGDGYVAAAGTKEGLLHTSFKKCGTAKVKDFIASRDGLLYVQVKTFNTSTLKPTVTLRFYSGAGRLSQNMFVALFIFKLFLVAIF